MRGRAGGENDAKCAQIPGKVPASAAPRASRNARNWVRVRTRAILAESPPHTRRIRASHKGAPRRVSIMLAGIWQSVYVIKKIPAPRPYVAASKPRSGFICKAPKARLVRSR